ncbi:MAG: ATP-binding cassette domain-containing protein [Thermaerobacter sp.]|nr:cell division ATP-binding protein FtsE [Bacillota bacterium]REJ38329.1 MAG: cell division ATP-binding protein FtsE [Bacillota bacterium]
MLVLQGVTMYYPGSPQPVFSDVNLRLEPGEFVFLTGPSGAGKTTLLRLIYSAARPAAGQVLFEDRPVASIPGHILRRRIGIVFQDNRLLAHRSVLDNVAFAGEVLGRPPGEVRRRAMDLLEQVGIADKARRRPHTLSAGERQRAAIARALMNQPRLLLADEPTGNLDPDNARRIFDLFVELNRSVGMACLVATHAVHLAAGYDRRMVHLEGGRLREGGPR